MDEGICQRKKWRERAAEGYALPWDSRLGYEKREDGILLETQKRHARARALCQRCPVLHACESYVSHMETIGVAIDGVVAGRYSDTKGKRVPTRPPTGTEEEIQTKCLACGSAMWPQATPRDRVVSSGVPQHAGEGLCEHCFPTFARQVRKRC